MIRIKTWINDWKFQKKLISICLVCSLIPVCILGFFSYAQAEQSYLEQEQIYLSQTISQEIQTLHYQLNAYLDSLKLMVQNEALQVTLKSNYTNNYQMYLAYRDIIDPLQETICLVQRDVKEVTIYSNCNIYPHGNILRPISEIAQTRWYQEVDISPIPTFYLSEEENILYLVCQMYDIKNTNYNIVCQKIDAKPIIESLNHLCNDSYGVYLLDEKQELVYGFQNYDSEIELKTILNYSDTMQQQKIIRPYLVVSQQIPANNWTLYVYQPTQGLMQMAIQIFGATLCICVLSMMLCIAASLVLSKIVTKPLEELSANMKNMERDNYRISIVAESKDEIGQLIQSFSHMVSRIKYLINEVYEIQIAKQKMELKVLQAQINPHFFYNCLSAINNQAIISGQDGISKMALHLSTYYRTSLNNGKDMISIQGELKNVTAYIEIMQMLRGETFQYICEVDGDVMDDMIPNLIIQPLVENAIIHGLDKDHSHKPGIITIRVVKEQDDLWIKVLDNGCGIEKEKCEKLLIEEEQGYGVFNIHKRIQLLYGSKYGLTVQSTPSFGSCVTMKLNISKNMDGVSVI